MKNPRVSWLFWFPSFFALPSFAKATADGASYAGRMAAGWCGEFVGSVDQSLTTSATTEMMSMVAEVLRLWSSALGSGILGSVDQSLTTSATTEMMSMVVGSPETLEQCLGFWYIG